MLSFLFDAPPGAVAPIQLVAATGPTLNPTFAVDVEAVGGITDCGAVDETGA